MRKILNVLFFFYTKILLLLFSVLFSLRTEAQINILNTELSGHKKLILSLHNQERAKVNSPALIWDEDLAQIAEEWANFLCSKENIFHKPNNDNGENIAYYGSSEELVDLPPLIKKMINLWIDEKKIYQYSPIPEISTVKVGHYTQLVWSNTQKVGCGLAKTEKPINGFYKYLLVCEYFKPGNIIGQYPY